MIDELYQLLSINQQQFVVELNLHYVLRVLLLFDFIL